LGEIKTCVFAKEYANKRVIRLRWSFGATGGGAEALPDCEEQVEIQDLRFKIQNGTFRKLFARLACLNAPPARLRRKARSTSLGSPLWGLLGGGSVTQHFHAGLAYDAR
jgi:hypothetical protein